MDSFNHFSKIAEEFDRLQSEVVAKTCLDLEAAEKAQIRANGQIDTGFMVNSVYSRTSQSSTYSVIGSPSKGAALPQVDAPPNNKTGYVGVAASYGFWQNYGTHTQPARPFVEPAIETVRPGFEAALGAIETKLGAVK